MTSGGTIPTAGWQEHPHVRGEDLRNILVRNVPDDVHAALARRAARRSQSLQQYLLGELGHQAEKRSLEEILDEIEAEGGGGLSFEDVVSTLDEERAARTERLGRRRDNR